MTKPSGNYTVMPERGRELFLTYDQEALIRRLDLPHTKDDIFVRFLGEEHRIRRADGRVLDAAGEQGSFEAVMSIYDILCHTAQPLSLKGEFVQTTALHHIHSTHSVHENFHSPGADFFDAHPDALRRACEAMGGTPATLGDISYVLPVFDFFPCCLRFWAADEEFPASLQYLWDARATDYVFYETLFYMMGALTNKLIALSKNE